MLKSIKTTAQLADYCFDVKKVDVQNIGGVYHWRFDTRDLLGDFYVVEMPKQFATEECARTALLMDLRKMDLSNA